MTVTGSRRQHPYQDATLPVPQRVSDLLGRMTVQDKAGLLFHPIITLNPDGSPVEDGTRAPSQAGTTELIAGRRITHFNLLHGTTPGAQARWHNTVQQIAEDTPLGIPVTFSTDPRHSFSDNPGTALPSGSFSQWPESLGLAAIGDPDLVHQYADTVRREYLAVGLRVALHPQIDLATDPRWCRIVGTFGEDAELTSRLVAPYLQGLRGPGRQLGPQSVAAIIKHFPGGGPQKDGEDPHFPYGKDQVYPGGRFDYHLAPFRAAIAAGATQMMPYYGKPVGTEYEEVAFGFNRGIITGLLREQLGFTGIVCADWAIITDQPIMGEMQQARAWGVEHLSPAERMHKALLAGVDQFGGESCPDILVALVDSGQIPSTRLDESVARLLTEKFRLGLFDEQRYVDPDQAEQIVGRSDFRAAGAAAQSRSVTVLKNTTQDGEPLLPLTGRPRVFVQGVDPAVAAEYAEIVDSPADAEAALLRVDTPFDPRPGRFESFFHAGRLDFPPDELEQLLAVLDTVPTVVAIKLDRPAVIPEIADRCAALLAGYGVNDRALMQVLFGQATPQGRLPFQLPRSVQEVEAGHPDVPQESPNPLFPFGFGLDLPTHQ